MSDFTFSLEDVKQSIEEQYAPVVINLGEAGTATLIQSARLSDEVQDQLIAMQSRFNEIRTAAAETPQTGTEDAPEDDAAKASRVREMRERSVGLLEEMFTIIAKTPSDAERIIEACNHDVLVLGGVFKRYGARTQLGEASASSDSSESTAGPSPQTSPNTTD